MIVYRKITNTEKGSVTIWGDDLIISVHDEDVLGHVKKMLESKFRMKDLGRLSQFLGIDFEISNNSVTMSQSKYVKTILERFDMVNCKPRTIPCEQKLQ